MKRICIIGPSGTGKTDLAKYIASRYRIPFISGSSKDITKKEGIKNHKELIKLCSHDPKKAESIYTSIMNMREEIQDDNMYFVTDRGIPDLLVYSQLQLIPHLDRTKALVLLKACKQLMVEQDMIYIFLPFNFKNGIEENGKRVANSLYQKMISLCFDLVVKKFLNSKQVITIEEWDWEERVKAIDKLFHVTKLDKFKNYFIKLWAKIRRKDQ